MQCKTILIVEDDEGIRTVLQLTLELEGYIVHTAVNGKDGLEVLPTLQTPCLILLDLMMPVMDGWAFAEVVGNNVTWATVPIVVVTAFDDKAKTLARARKVIKKPVDIDLLLRVAREYCGPRLAAS